MSRIIPHRPGWSKTLEGLPSRAIIDSNVLLDASLVADGFGAKTLEALNQEGVGLFVDDTSYRDAVRVLLKLQDRAPSGNLEELIVKCMLRHSILSVPPGDANDFPFVKRQDRHLARAAHTLEAFVVSDDAPLLLELHRSKIEARTTKEITLHSFGSARTPMFFMFTGLYFGSGASFMFIRCRPHEPVVDGTRRESTLWESLLLGRFFYDRLRPGFVFEAAWNSETAFLPFEVVANQSLILGINFDFGRRDGSAVSLRAAFTHPLEAGMSESNASRSTILRGRPMPGFDRGELRIGNSYALGNGWAGDIAGMSWGPRRLGSDAWQSYRLVPGTSGPNPITSDTLGVAVSLLDYQGQYVKRPRLDDIIRQVANTLLLDLPR